MFQKRSLLIGSFFIWLWLRLCGSCGYRLDWMVYDILCLACEEWVRNWYCRLYEYMWLVFLQVCPVLSAISRRHLLWGKTPMIVRDWQIWRLFWRHLCYVFCSLSHLCMNISTWMHSHTQYMSLITSANLWLLCADQAQIDCVIR